MRIGLNHSIVILLLPVFWHFSSGALPALRLFAAYTLVFYFPGYLLATFLMGQYPPAFRTIAGIFLGVAALPQFLYYLSAFSNPVAYYPIVLAGVVSMALSLAMDMAEKRS